MNKLNLITGNDPFKVMEYAKDVVINICGKDYKEHPDLELIKGDNENLQASEILAVVLNTLRTPSFLSPHKIVWLKNFIHFEKVLKGTAQSRKGSTMEAITEFVKNGIPDDITLIIDGINIKRNSTFYKACDKNGSVTYIEKVVMKDEKAIQANVSSQVREFFQINQLNAPYNVMSYLIETLPVDSGILSNELNKLLCYLGEKKDITIEDCQICTKTPESLSWVFTDALGSKNKVKALQTIKTLMTQKTTEKGMSQASELMLISVATKKYQDIIKVKYEMNKYNIPANVNSNYFQNPSLKEQNQGAMLFTGHPYRAYMLCQEANSISNNVLPLIIEILQKTYEQIVTGTVPARIALEQMTIKIIDTRS